MEFLFAFEVFFWNFEKSATLIKFFSLSRLKKINPQRKLRRWRRAFTLIAVLCESDLDKAKLLCVTARVPPFREETFFIRAPKTTRREREVMDARQRGHAEVKRSH